MTARHRLRPLAQPRVRSAHQCASACAQPAPNPPASRSPRTSYDRDSCECSWPRRSVGRRHWIPQAHSLPRGHLPPSTFVRPVGLCRSVREARPPSKKLGAVFKAWQSPVQRDDATWKVRNDMRLAGKVALISGGARGMRAAETRFFAREGAGVVIGDIFENEGREVEADVRARGGACIFVPGALARDPARGQARSSPPLPMRSAPWISSTAGRRARQRLYSRRSTPRRARRKARSPPRRCCWASTAPISRRCPAPTARDKVGDGDRVASVVLGQEPTQEPGLDCLTVSAAFAVSGQAVLGPRLQRARQASWR